MPQPTAEMLRQRSVAYNQIACAGRFKTFLIIVTVVSRLHDGDIAACYSAASVYVTVSSFCIQL